jgi:hypothetical protein
MTASASVIAPRPERWYQRRIDAHFGGRGAPAEERELRAHLPACAACRDYYDRHLRLAELDPAGALPMRARLARGLGLAATPAAAPRRLMLLSGALALGIAALTVGLGSRPGLREQVQARGGAAAPGSQLLVYELANDKPPHPVTSEVRGDSALAFAYANVGRKRHLLVFAVDDDRRVYWYHPTWRTPEEDPVAIDIVQDDQVREIPAAITHHFAGPRLQLFGVFVDEALAARQLEALVARAPVDDQRRLQLSVAGAEVTRIDLRLVGGK